MRMTVLLFDGFTALDVVGGYEVLANVPGIEVEFAATRPRVIATDTRRLGMLAYRDLASITETDILYVPGGPGVDALLQDADVLGWLQRMHRSATWTVGICNGVALLAAAGALDRTTVTTNWGWRDRVGAYGVQVVAERFHRDGSVVTGAGVSASIDAGLMLASLVAGEGIAQLIQLGIEYFPAPPAFARGRVEEVPAEERDLILQFERGTVRDRLADPIPWTESTLV